MSDEVRKKRHGHERWREIQNMMHSGKLNVKEGYGSWGRWRTATAWSRVRLDDVGFGERLMAIVLRCDDLHGVSLGANIAAR